MFLCLQSTPPRHLPSLNPSGTDRSNLRGQDWNFLSSGRATLRPGYWCLKMSLPTPTFHSFLSAPSPLWPLSHPLITAWVRVDSETPLQRGGFKSGGQACFCVSKVRLRCRMLSFSGWWLQSEQDDNADPRGWRVKRYGKTWINRGPGILSDSMWPKLSLDPMGG